MFSRAGVYGLDLRGLAHAASGQTSRWRLSPNFDRFLTGSILRKLVETSNLRRDPRENFDRPPVYMDTIQDGLEHPGSLQQFSGTASRVQHFNASTLPTSFFALISKIFKDFQSKK
jgi:hypothetical protein